MTIYKITLLGFLMLMATANLSAQDASESYNAKLELDGEPMQKEVKLKVSGESSEVNLTVNGMISGGNLKVYLYDPQGKQVANLNLRASEGSKAKGRLSETQDASPGTWKLKIDNDGATGKVTVLFSQL